MGKYSSTKSKGNTLKLIFAFGIWTLILQIARFRKQQQVATSKQQQRKGPKVYFVQKQSASQLHQASGPKVHFVRNDGPFIRKTSPTPQVVNPGSKTEKQAARNDNEDAPATGQDFKKHENVPDDTVKDKKVDDTIKEFEKTEITPNEPAKDSKKMDTAIKVQADDVVVKAAKFPAACNENEKQILSFQLPAFRCKKTSSRPFMHHCSFSYATRCPHNIWFTKQYDGTTVSSTSTAVFLGCKDMGVKALDTLRVVSGDAQFDRNSWQSHLGELGNPDECLTDQPEVSSKKEDSSSSTVHCIESTPLVAYKLTKAAKGLGWEDNFKVTNAVVRSDHDKRSINIDGTDVRVTSLESLAGDQNTIEFLHIDGGSFAYDIFQSSAMRNVKYVEFEYDWKKAWKDHALSEVINLLKSSGFVCYFAGAFGNIWRITDCWLEHYSEKFWSNIACVNLEIADDALATNMEDLFQKTLAKEYSIKYLNERTVGTNGVRMKHKFAAYQQMKNKQK